MDNTRLRLGIAANWRRHFMAKRRYLKHKRVYPLNLLPKTLGTRSLCGKLQAGEACVVRRTVTIMMFPSSSMATQRRRGLAAGANARQRRQHRRRIVELRKGNATGDAVLPVGPKSVASEMSPQGVPVLRLDSALKRRFPRYVRGVSYSRLTLGTAIRPKTAVANSRQGKGRKSSFHCSITS